MPSTVVHLALAGLLAAGLLGAAFDLRALAVVFVAAAIPDLDAFASLVVESAHRAVLHTFLLPMAIGLVLWYDTRYRETSFVRARWDHTGVRVAWVSLLSLAIAGIGLDMFTNGVNVFYPVHDQFYQLDGEILLSTHDGIVQTFVDLSQSTADGASSGGGSGGEVAVGSTDETFYSSGVDPWEGEEPANVERTVPVVRSGQQLLLVVTSAVVVGGRLIEQRVAGER
ncbi:metal-dependent hydrolase [Halorhabdus sp. CBA1104]|uniref:metal-dependent hydrolase n=1 Tax=unclassified Halorhabdus TaxID=2621901 RepID=UPI0012B37BAF|nr:MULTISPECIES: metal-dependent hydrolase [unclassified Halorhabdus]QGN06892.1 metal-dependent hydrolase [Halorhabdus sp. CBA1104]